MTVDWRVVREREDDYVQYTLRAVGPESPGLVDEVEMPLMAADSVEELESLLCSKYQRARSIVRSHKMAGVPETVDEDSEILAEIGPDVARAFTKPHMDLLPDGRLVQVRDGQREMFL